MTPEEIVALIGNISNRPDIRETQERQVREIKALISEVKALIESFPLTHTRSCSYDNAFGDEGDFCTCNLRERSREANRIWKLL